MKKAIDEAKKAYSKGAVPVGSVLVSPNGKIVSYGHNDYIKNNKGIHSEITVCNNFLKNNPDVHSLKGYSLYVTLEPCLMCFSFLCLNRISNIYYGASNSKYGYSKYIIDLKKGFLKNVNVEGNILEKENSIILKSFFERMRNE